MTDNHDVFLSNLEAATIGASMATVHAPRLRRNAGALSRTPKGRGAAQAQRGSERGNAVEDFTRIRRSGA
jgi:hypothetical protein